MNSLTSLELFDFMSAGTTTAVIFGYFRKQRFLTYNIKCDDFVSIISKYLIYPIIKIGKNNQTINAFDSKKIDFISASNKQLVFAICVKLRQLLSIYILIIHTHKLIITALL